MEDGNFIQDKKHHCKDVPTAAEEYLLCLLMEQMISGSLGVEALVVIAFVSLQRPTMEHVTKLAMVAIGCINTNL